VGGIVTIGTMHNRPVSIIWRTLLNFSHCLSFFLSHPGFGSGAECYELEPHGMFDNSFVIVCREERSLSLPSRRLDFYTRFTRVG